MPERANASWFDGLQQTLELKGFTPFHQAMSPGSFETQFLFNLKQ
jgi:hypothetical protein